MRCEECQALVEEYFDRELDERTAGAVSIHIENCLSCSAALEQLTLEHRAYQSYGRELDVSPRLWVKVREQLAEKSTHQTLTLFRPGSPGGQPAWGGSRLQIEFRKLLSLRFNVAVSVALVLFAVLATVAVMKYLNKQQSPKQIASSLETPVVEKQLSAEIEAPHEPVKSNGTDGRRDGFEKSTAGLRPASVRRRSLPDKVNEDEPKGPEQLVREAERKYLSAIALLTRDAEQRPSRLDSETRVKLDGALAAIDRTILSTRKAVQRNPNDPLAVQYMLSAYGKKVDVLKEMSSY